MYIAEQIINPTEQRLRLSAQYGVSHIVVDTRPNEELKGPDGAWDARKVAAQRKWVESLGLKLDVLAVDIDSILLDSIYRPDRAKAIAERAARTFAPPPTASDDIQIQRPDGRHHAHRLRRRAGWGALQCFPRGRVFAEKDKSFSYWGVGHPGGGAHGADIAVNAIGTKEAVGQVLGSETGGVSEKQGWDALEFFVEQLIPTAEKAGVRLAGRRTIRRIHRAA